jgi:hypothetical protein
MVTFTVTTIKKVRQSQPVTSKRYFLKMKCQLENYKITTVHQFVVKKKKCTNLNLGREDELESH